VLTNISPQRQKLIIYIILTLAVLAVFGQVNKFDFVNLDEIIYVKENLHIQSGITWNELHWVLTTKYIGLWTPLTLISFMFDYHFYGLNPGGYHLTNLILHILSTLLLFWLFNRMTKEIWKSAFVAALFALHPLHVESVAWIAERKDVLSAFFWMLTLCLYVYYTEKQGVGRYLLVLSSYVLALMSKPMTVTLPLIMILLDYWPLKRFEFKKDNLFHTVGWQLKEKIIFFILSMIFVIVTLYSPEKSSIIVKQFPLTDRLANASISFLTYLEKTFWPHDMSTFYLFPDRLPIWQSLGSAIIIIIITITVIAMAKRFRHLFVGWLWYVIVLLPVIGIIQINEQSMADRYSYLPSIGIFIMSAWGIPLLFPREYIRMKILFPMALVILLILSFLSWRQCGYWKDSKTLFSHALQATKNNYLAYNNLGSVLHTEGKIREAIDQYNKAIHIKPDFALCYLNRGTAYGMIGQYQRAIEDYNEAINRKYDYADAYNSKAVIYLIQGNRIAGCNDAQKACSMGVCATLEEAKLKGYCN
jgi:protein O-mannosyl-transferase